MIWTEEMKKERSILYTGRIGYFRGRKHSSETKEQMSKQRLGKPNKSSTKFKKGHVPWIKTHGTSMETRQKQSILKKGKRMGINHPRWIHDRTKLKRYDDTNKDRRSSAYRDWRKQVWLRDNFKCKIENQDCSGRLEAHHILGWTEYPELRYDINNGITLCHAHHPRKRAEEKRLSPYFQELVSVSKE